LYKSNPAVTHSLKGARFQLLSLSSDNLVSKFAASNASLCRYAEELAILQQQMTETREAPAARVAQLTSLLSTEVGLCGL
jgi:hypothetical protein